MLDVFESIASDTVFELTKLQRPMHGAFDQELTANVSICYWNGLPVDGSDVLLPFFMPWTHRPAAPLDLPCIQ